MIIAKAKTTRDLTRGAANYRLDAPEKLSAKRLAILPIFIRKRVYRRESAERKCRNEGQYGKTILKDSIDRLK